MAENNTKFNRGGAELSIELLDKLQAATNKENVLISPLSIQTCMALAFTGAKGATAEEIAKVMNFPSNCTKDVANSFHQVLSKYENNKLVKIANKVYVQEGHTIKPEYAAITKEKYYASAESINFAENVAAANKINNWVEEKTSGKITDLIPSDALDADTRLILLNALHFKGEWQEKFDPEDTKEDDFWLNENESIQVEFMRNQGDFRLGYLPDYECEALEMPYKDSDLSMFVLLPVKRDGLKALVEKLKGVNLLDLDQQLSTASNMIVKFPKFKIEYSIELSKVMQEMGIKTAFEAADLSNMLESETQGVYVSDIFHKTSIEVNEEGCEAAAATGLVATFRCMPRQFMADCPFLYFIWNKKNILFAGAFVKPPQIGA
ncbi:serine protease inhibitor 42Dd-like [Musca vetustissima]|uniref:serine protease inhibitor 42Dd-like n=1 Tax=Musca vetustissima TaxID=27455 RepID=UPI002AB60E19|nr:serine protease inhibitor 42Dd-like [Musca vetustissima]